MLTFRVLGPLSVERDGREVSLGGQKQRAVLALLLAAGGRSVSADRLIDAIWGDQLPADPANTLRHYVSRLRTTLHAESGAEHGRSELLRKEGTGYLLDLEHALLDGEAVAELMAGAEAISARGRPDDAIPLFEEALSWVRGEALSDLTHLDALRPEIERLNELIARLRESFFESRLALGNDSALIGDLAAETARSPLRERLWGQLMLSLYRDGRQAEALRAYQAARRHLSDELGIEPGPELTDLEDRILQQDEELLTGVEAPPAIVRVVDPPAKVPTPPTSFVGRESLVAAVVDDLARHRIVTLLGPGGVGKTRVAIEVARRVEQTYEDGVVVVWLDPVDDPALVPNIVARALGLAENPDLDVIETIERRLSDRRSLLVLDNCERLARACAGLSARLVSACPGVTIMATSQHALKVAGERLVEVPSMSVDGPPDVDGEDEGVALFVERAGDVRPGFSPDAAELDTIREIVRQLDGIPLGIELAAARTRILGTRQIREALADRFEALMTGDTSRPERQRSLEAAIQWSMSLLTDDERDLLERMSIFAGPFDAGAALGIIDGATLDSLTDLLDKSLVIGRRGPNGSVVYRLLESVRLFVRAAAQNRPWWQEMAERHAEYYADLAEQAEVGLRTPSAETWLQELDLAEDNIVVAMQRALDRDDIGMADRLFAGFSRYFDWRGRVSTPNMWIARIEAAAGDRPLSARFMVWAGMFAWELGQYDRAADLCEASIAAAEEDRDTLIKAIGLAALGLVQSSRMKIDDAYQLNVRAYDLSKTLVDPWYEAWAATALARPAAALGRFAEVEELGFHSLAAFRRMGDRNGEAWSLLMLSTAAAPTDHALAVRYAGDALLVAHSIGATRSISWALEELAMLARTGDEPEKAVVLMSAMDALQVRRGTPIPTSKRDDHDVVVAELRLELGVARFDELWSEGSRLDMEKVVAGG